MTTGTNPEPSARHLRNWAAAQLELEPDLPAREVRQVFMQRLRDEDFMPPWRWQQAYQALNGASYASLVGQAFQDEEERLRSEVDEFAAQFFHLDVAPRRERWEALLDQCAFSLPLTARLRALERGLPLTEQPVQDHSTGSEQQAVYLLGKRVSGAPANDGSGAQQLAEHVRALFVLRPCERAVQRQEILRTINPGNVEATARAARQLIRYYPQLAALEPVLIDQLCTWSQRVGQRDKMRRKRARATPVAATSGGSSGGFGKGWLWIVFVIGMLVRAASTGTNSRPTYTPPSYSVPTVPQFDAERWRRQLDEINKANRPVDPDAKPDDVIRRLLDTAPRGQDGKPKPTSRDGKEPPAKRP